MRFYTNQEVNDIQREIMRLREKIASSETFSDEIHDCIRRVNKLNAELEAYRNYIFENIPKTKEAILSFNLWSERYRFMATCMPTAEGRAAIIEALTQLGQTKDLSFGERKMLDDAKNYEAARQRQVDLARALELDAIGVTDLNFHRRKRMKK